MRGVGKDRAGNGWSGRVTPFFGYMGEKVCGRGVLGTLAKQYGERKVMAVG